jgi:hypothetical protein
VDAAVVHEQRRVCRSCSRSCYQLHLGLVDALQPLDHQRTGQPGLPVVRDEQGEVLSCHVDRDLGEPVGLLELLLLVALEDD